MAVTHVNRKRITYFLHVSKTKSGKPKFFFSKDPEEVLLDSVPEGYEIYENPNAQVFLRKKIPQLVTNEEIEIVRNGLRKNAPAQRCIVDVKKDQIVIYQAEGGYFHQMFRFTLWNEKSRRFSVDRWCFRGSIDDWFPLLGGQGKLSRLVETYCRHLGEESFFELM